MKATIQVSLDEVKKVFLLWRTVIVVTAGSAF